MECFVGQKLEIFGEFFMKEKGKKACLTKVNGKIMNSSYVEKDEVFIKDIFKIVDNTRVIKN